MPKKWCMHKWSKWLWDGYAHWRICLKCGHGEYQKSKWSRKT